MSEKSYVIAQEILGELVDKLRERYAAFPECDGDSVQDDVYAGICAFVDRIQAQQAEPVEVLRQERDRLLDRLNPGVEYVDGIAVGPGEDEIVRQALKITMLRQRVASLEQVEQSQQAIIQEQDAKLAELEAECNDLAHQLNQCNERGGKHLQRIAELEAGYRRMLKTAVIDDHGVPSIEFFRGVAKNMLGEGE